MLLALNDLSHNINICPETPSYFHERSLIFWLTLSLYHAQHSSRVLRREKGMDGLEIEQVTPIY
jgi:hypothetical protein